MPAMLDDPTSPVIFRTSGDLPHPTAGGPLPSGIAPRQVVLRDRVTIATIIPFSAPNQVPMTLLAYLCDQLGREIEKGDTYPMIDPIPQENFGPYWFGVFGTIMLLGEYADGRDLHEMARLGCDWEKICLGSFYIKPNYPGRSSHVCNGGFLVTDASRNRGVGRLMGETYLDWAPKLGYTYSVFNLVYETNVASCRIWDALGFKRLGRVKGCGNLKSYPGELVDAIIYGRDLGKDDDFVSEERFDKIRFYLKHKEYPSGADRAEKSRLRSAATHYKLIPETDTEGEKLMLKGKEVISDPQRQYEIARDMHHKSHGGINKTTASIAESFHWVRIKETVSQVIRNCPECSEMNKTLAAVRAQQSQRGQPSTQDDAIDAPTATAIMVTQPSQPQPQPQQQQQQQQQQQHQQEHQPYEPPQDTLLPSHRGDSPSGQLHVESAHHYPSFAPPSTADYEMPVDPALMESAARSGHLPPSPFVPAKGDLAAAVAAAGRLAAGSQGAKSRSSMDGPDTYMSGTGAHDAGATTAEELRRRLASAGFPK